MTKQPDKLVQTFRIGFSRNESCRERRSGMFFGRNDLRDTIAIAWTIFVVKEGHSQTEYRKQLSEFMATLRPTPSRK